MEENSKIIERAEEIVKYGFDTEDDIQLILKKLVQAYKDQQSELEKKDRIIDEMAEDYSKYQTLKSYPNEITETAFGIKDRILKGK